MNKEVSEQSRKFRAIIAGTGSYVPEGYYTNSDLSKMVETSDEWIKTRTGIEVRHICSKEESTATLASQAAKKAIESSGLKATDLDLIIVSTITPEMVFPSTACFVQAEIKAKNSAAFDLSAACSGFIYGVTMAQGLIESGVMKTVMVIGAETLSKITDWTNRESCILFGDGAGAVILQRAEKEESRGIIYSTMSSDGSKWEALNCQAHGSRFPASEDLDDPKMVYMQIRGREVYQLAVRRIIEAVNECFDYAGITIDDLDMFISHQMNARIIESAAKRLRLPEEKTFINIHEYGNTSAASLPIALDDCIRQGRLKRGDLALFVAFGAGLTWGANLLEY